MPIWTRTNDTWVSTNPSQRSADSWRQANLGFVRQSDTWVQFYSSIQDLLGVSDFAVIGTPTSYGVTVGWVLPEQDPAHTEIQIRIAELGAIWTELDPAATSFSWSALDPATAYVAQIRLIIRTLGVITHTSEIANLEFTTLVAPISGPGEDPGSPGGTDSSWNIGFPIDGDAVGTPFGTWWEWKLEILGLSVSTVDWTPTGITGSFSGADSSFVYDAALLDNTRVYRMCVRTAQDTTGDGVADVFGDWDCSESFPGQLDWGANCGAIPNSPTTALSAAADAVWAFPKYCQLRNDGLDTPWTDAVSGLQVGVGAHYAAMHITNTAEFGGISSIDNGITFTAGLASIASTIIPDQDFSIVSRFRFPSSYSFTNGKVTTVASISQGAILLQIVETASGWYPIAKFRLTSSFVTLSGILSEQSLSTETQTIALTWDSDGIKTLYLNSVELDNDSSNETLHPNSGGQPMYWTGMVQYGQTLQQLGWNRVLSLAELGEFDALTGNFVDQFDDDNTSPWIVEISNPLSAFVTESITAWPDSVKGIQLVGRGSGSSGNGSARITYPYEITYSNYIFEYRGGPRRANWGSALGQSVAYIWFRGSNDNNCLRLGTYDYDGNVNLPSGGGLMFHKIVNGAVVDAVELHSHSHHGVGTLNEYIRVVCNSGVCQAQEWDGVSWNDLGTPINDDGTMGGYFGARAAGFYSLGGQQGIVDLDYIQITKL